MRPQYKEPKAPDVNIIKIDLLDIISKEFVYKDVEFLKTIVDFHVDKYNNTGNLQKYSLSGYNIFVKPYLIKEIENEINLIEIK